MSDEPTLPPHQPNTPRVWLRKALVWAKAHPDWLIVFALGFIAGAVLI